MKYSRIYLIASIALAASLLLACFAVYRAEPPPLAGPSLHPAPQPEQPKADQAENDSPVLKQWADSLPLGSMEPALLDLEADDATEERAALLSSWAERDLDGFALWFSNRDAADVLHQEAREELLRAFGRYEQAEIFAWMLHSLPESAFAELSGPFFRRWAHQDAESAAAALREAMEKSSDRATLWKDLLGQFASQWAAVDLNRALQWMRAMPDGPAKSHALILVSYRWAEIDPYAAAANAARRNEPELIQAVASTWALSNPEAAAAWASGLPEGEAQTTAITGAAAIWAQKAPEEAAAFANNLPIGENRNRAQVAVASMWADLDPPRAARWVEQLPEGPAREQAMRQVIVSWTVGAPAEARRWLELLPEAPSRDSAVHAFCDVTGATDPADAFTWAATITEEALRNRTLERAANMWLAKNPAAARRYIAQSNLPVEIKHHLTKGSSVAR